MYPLRFYQGGCEVDPPIVVDFIVEDGTQACPTVQCSSSDYQEFVLGFVAPVNYTLNCFTPASYAGITTPSTLETQYQIPISSGKYMY